MLAGTEDPERIAETLLDYYSAVVLTLGVKGTLYADRKRTRVPAAPARAIDTTGAGDALCAGFLAAWLTGTPAGEALTRGIGLASCAIERVGGRPEG